MACAASCGCGRLRKIPLNAVSYGPLETKDGKRRFEVAQVRAVKDHLIARLKGVETREAAAALNGIELYVARSQASAAGGR